MTAILVRFPDESVKLEGVAKRRILTKLKVIYKLGTLHGKTAHWLANDIQQTKLEPMPFEKIRS